MLSRSSRKIPIYLSRHPISESILHSALADVRSHMLQSFPESVELRILIMSESTLRFRKGLSSNGGETQRKDVSENLPSSTKQGYTSIGFTISFTGFLKNGDSHSLAEIIGNYSLVPDSRKEDMQFLNESWSSRLVYFRRDILYILRDIIIKMAISDSGIRYNKIRFSSYILSISVAFETFKLLKFIALSANLNRMSGQ